jgi:hypothetical protein
LLSFDKKILEEKKELYKELIKNDRNKVLDKVLQTDETLLEIMNKKKKIMREFLTSIKESSVDCFYNYEYKEKCLTFPLGESSRTRNKRRVNIQYKDDRAKEVVVKTNIKEMDGPTINNNAEYVENNDIIVLKKMYLYDENDMKKMYAIDDSSLPYKVYDYNSYKKNKAFVELGIVEVKNKKNYLSKI